MAVDALADDMSQSGELESPKRKWLSGKRLVLFIILPLLGLSAGGAALFSSGILSGGDHAEEQVAETPKEAAFYDLPDLLVNLQSDSRKPSYLKMSISLELTRKEDQPELEKLLPRVIDNFQIYLRELRLEDLRGSAGMHRLREELLLRVNAAAKPITIKDVLFREMLVQ